ncbi:DUF3231 family protein [Gracilibacillus sp. HCP3S3_G5_1]|uniref:DUF3231 family protein n=1 Tax=unclassified Gracilibacillus TaxID=2625209 RepID=UPI003F8B69DD
MWGVLRSLSKSTILSTPKQVDFVQQQSYLHGFFGEVRSLHALEVAHLYDNIENNVTSKGLLIAFSQIAKNEKIQKY